MINLDQVKTLEWKVKQAVQLVVHLRRENDTLRGRLSDTEVRLQELETTLVALKANQNEMESGIRSALEELDHLEGAEAPQTVQVDPVSYPPEVAAPAVTAASVVAPVAAVAPAVAPVEGTEVASEAEVEDQNRAFEEEFAALAAAEEAAKAVAIAEEAEATVSEPVSSIPESVELEEAPSPEESDLFDEPEAPSAVPEEHQPEQPGLGIF